MADDIQNQNGLKNNIDFSELKPVKSRFKKVLSIGTTIIVGGVVLAVFAPLFIAPKCRGTTLSSRLKYEQRRMEIQKQLEEELQKEIDEKD
jgi:hypothetical protein